MISLFKMAPKLSAQVLSSVPKGKKPLRCLMKKICVLDTKSYIAADCEFDVTESTIDIN